MTIQTVMALDIDKLASGSTSAGVEATNYSHILGVLGTEERNIIQRLSKVFRARHASFASCLGALAVTCLLEHSTVERQTLGIVVAGGNAHIPPSWEFAMRAIEAGPGLVNPAQFPHLLPSAIATTIASTVGAHGPALAVGGHSNTFSNALDTAKLLLIGNIVKSCVIVTVSQTDWPPPPIEKFPCNERSVPDGAIAVLMIDSDLDMTKWETHVQTQDIVPYTMPPYFADALNCWIHHNP